MVTASNGGGSVSLESGIRTCKVVTGWASRVQSDRFQNPNLMVCPIWNGVDTAGRRVCPDSFVTKRAGCNSATDRVVVENNVSRPQYMEYVNLNAAGIAAPIYGKTLPYQQEVARTRDARNVLPSDKSLGITGQFGNGGGFTGETLKGCNGMGSSAGHSSYNKTYPMEHQKIKNFPMEQYQMAQQHQHNRQAASMQNGYGSYNRRQAAGF
jgi:hypothetical protein